MTATRLSGHLGRNWLLLPLALVAIGSIGWAALTPIRTESRDRLVEIPEGTWARRMAGNKGEILSAAIRLTLGVSDILVLKNLDDVPQVFGSILMMPGQSFRLPFAMAASYQFSCTAHLSGQMSIIVEPNPRSPWARLSWRAANLWRSGAWP